MQFVTTIAVCVLLVNMNSWIIWYVFHYSVWANLSYARILPDLICKDWLLYDAQKRPNTIKKRTRLEEWSLALETSVKVGIGEVSHDVLYILRACVDVWAIRYWILRNSVFIFKAQRNLNLSDLKRTVLTDCLHVQWLLLKRV